MIIVHAKSNLLLRPNIRTLAYKLYVPERKRNEKRDKNRELEDMKEDEIDSQDGSREMRKIKVKNYFEMQRIAF